MKHSELRHELGRLRALCSTLEALPIVERDLLLKATPEEQSSTLSAIEHSLKRMLDALVTSNQLVKMHLLMEQGGSNSNSMH